MKTIVSRRNTCRLCGRNELKCVLQLKPTPIADAYLCGEYVYKVEEAYPLDLFLCHSCGHLQLLDVIDPDIIYKDYLYEMSSSYGLLEHFNRYAGDVLRRLNLSKGSLVVDIGSNDGSLLQFFRNRGMRVLGLDPTKHITQKARESGIETIAAYFSSEEAYQIRKTYGRASVITASHLFANLDNLGDITEGIRELLTPEGSFVFESFYLVDMVQNMVFDFIYHEHLSYFSVKPLEAFFRRHGMALIDVESVDTKGGSLRYIVQLSNPTTAASPNVVKFVELENSFGADRAETFQAFEDRINTAKDKLVCLIKEIKAQGKNIAGYGASATTTTLIYHYELGKVLDFLADDNSAKQNRFSPGYHIPVLPSEQLYKRKPDYIVILAWRYAETIIKKHRAFLEQGGHFIVPLPELRVV